MAEGGIDVVLLDLGLPDSSGISTFLKLREAAPGLPIILLSGTGNESIALEAVQQGAQDYLIKSSCNRAVLLKSLSFARARHRFRLAPPEGVETGRGRVVGILGAQGGAGATTVACSLAVELRRLTQTRVLLIDAVIDSGMVAFHLGFEPRHTVLDALEILDRVDADLLKGLTHVFEEVNVMSSPSIFGGLEYDSNGFRHLISLARLHFDWIVLDLGRPGPLAMAALRDATDVLLITNPTIPGLFEAKRLLNRLTSGSDALAVERNSQGGDRIKLVVNQGERSTALRPRDVAQIFGSPVYAQLPGASEEINYGLIRRALPSPASSIRREIASLAQKLAGIQPVIPARTVPAILSALSKRFVQARVQ